MLDCEELSESVGGGDDIDEAGGDNTGADDPVLVLDDVAELILPAAYANCSHTVCCSSAIWVESFPRFRWVVSQRCRWRSSARAVIDFVPV